MQIPPHRRQDTAGASVPGAGGHRDTRVTPVLVLSLARLHPESPLPLGQVLPDQPFKKHTTTRFPPPPFFFCKSENSTEEAPTLECTVNRQSSCGCTPLQKNQSRFSTVLFTDTRYLICKGTKTRLEPILEMCPSQFGHPHKAEKLLK